MTTKPYIGMPVLYVLRPGQIRAGQGTLAAMITAVNAGHANREESVDLVIYIPRTETQHMPNVQRGTEKVTSHCWVPIVHPFEAALREEIAVLTEQVATLAEAVQALNAASTPATPPPAMEPPANRRPPGTKTQ